MTKMELPRRVMLEHRAIDADADPTPREYEDIIAVYTEQHAALRRDGLVNWGIDDDIPDECSTPMVLIVASRTFKMFSGEPVDRNAAVRELARALAPKYVPVETEADYF